MTPAQLNLKKKDFVCLGCVATQEECNVKYWTWPEDCVLRLSGHFGDDFGALYINNYMQVAVFSQWAGLA